MGASIKTSYYSESIKIKDIDIFLIIILLTYDPDMSHMIFSGDCGSPFLFIARALTQAHTSTQNGQQQKHHHLLCN